MNSAWAAVRAGVRGCSRGPIGAGRRPGLGCGQREPRAGCRRSWASAARAMAAEARVSRWYFGGLASCGAACCTHPLDLLKVRAAREGRGGREGPGVAGEARGPPTPGHRPAWRCTGPGGPETWGCLMVHYPHPKTLAHSEVEVPVAGDRGPRSNPGCAQYYLCDLGLVAWPL